MIRRAWQAFSAVTSHPIAVRVMQAGCVVIVVGALSACTPATTSGQLPTVPADIQSCFRTGPVKVPQKALTVAEVESLWKQDRVRSAVMQACGQRFLAWYGDLQKRWR